MRDLRSEIQSKVQKGMAKLGTVRETCTYNVMGAPSYDAELGNSTDAVIGTYQVAVVFSEFSFNKNNAANEYPDEAPFLAIDRWLLISSLDLPAVPTIQDVVVDPNGTSWRIMAVGGDPAMAHWSLHGRPFDE